MAKINHVNGANAWCIELFKAQVAARIGREPHEILLKRQGERPFKDQLTLQVCICPCHISELALTYPQDYGVSNGVQLDLWATTTFSSQYLSSGDLLILTTRLQGSRYWRLNRIRNCDGDIELSFGNSCDHIRQEAVWPRIQRQILSIKFVTRKADCLQQHTAVPVSGIYYDMNLCHSLTVLSHHLMYRTSFLVS